VRVGYLIPEFPGQTHVFFWREIVALRAQGVTVRLLSTRRPKGTSRHDFAAAAAEETHYAFPPQLSALRRWVARRAPGVQVAVHYLNSLSSRDLKARLRSLALLASAIDLLDYARTERLDHIHVHSCADAAHVVALCRKLGGPPYSLTLHGDLEVYGTDHRLKMEGAAFVAAVGNHLVRQLVGDVGLPQDRLLATCMGVDTRRLASIEAKPSARVGHLRIATVARLNRMKGHLHALAAVRRAVDEGVDIEYTIAGEGEYRPEIERCVRALSLGDRVHLVGTLSEGEVLSLLSCTDAFVLASVGAGEAWPVSVMEAMGAGVPVISSVIGATTEMITSGVDGLLVEQRDEAGLAAAMVRLARDQEARIRMGENARATAQRRFDVSVTARRLLEAVSGAPAPNGDPRPSA
jgi:glycosyltransferase involved in cell wall biosynthesis